MKIYWSISSIPEIAALPQEERGRAWRRAYLKCFQTTSTWLGLLICGLCAGLGSILGDHFVYRILGSAIGGGIGGFVFSQIAVRNTIPFIRKAIEEN